MQEELPYFKHTNDFLLRATGHSIIDYARYYGYPEAEVKILQLEGIDDKRLKPVIVQDADLKSFQTARDVIYDTTIQIIVNNYKDTEFIF